MGTATNQMFVSSDDTGVEIHSISMDGRGWMCQTTLCSFVLRSYCTHCCCPGGCLGRAEHVLALVLIAEAVTTPPQSFVRGHEATTVSCEDAPWPCEEALGLPCSRAAWGSAFCPRTPSPVPLLGSGFIPTALPWLLLLCPCCGAAQVTPWDPQLMARRSQDRPLGWTGLDWTGLDWAGLD